MEGKNCGGILCSRMMDSIPEWNIGMTMGQVDGSRISLLTPILKNRIGRSGAW